MYVFKSNKLEKQLNKDSKRKEIIQRLNKIIEKLFTYKNINELEKDKDLGFKKYKGKNYKVYGIDLGKTHSSSMNAERLLVSFLEPSNNTQIFFKNIENTNEMSILLHFYCKHDSQNKKANYVNQEFIELQEYIPIENEFNNNTINEIEDELEYNSIYERFIEANYEKPKISVLTLNKTEIIDKFIYDTKPTILTGIAGSGKTEVIIGAMRIISNNNPNESILYITNSERLVNSVEAKCSTFKNNILFHSLKSLIREYTNSNLSIFEDITTFEMFINEYKNSYENTNYQLKSKIISFINNNEIYKIYSEIYGLLMGYMLDNWNRTDIEYIKKEDYLSLPKDYKIFPDNLDILYEFTNKYINYLSKNNIKSYNIECMKLLNNLSFKKYNYIFIDEIQDLTEVQINFIYKLVNNKKNIMVCGDVKQVINPTFFQKGRIQTLFEITSNDNIHELTSNFRNSKRITEYINELNAIRKEKLPSFHLEDAIEETSINNTVGNIYYYKGNIKEIFNLLDGANDAIIMCKEEIEKYKNAGINTLNFYTPQQVKGNEFENVCVLNILTNLKDVFENIYNSKKIYDYSLHYNFNYYYVAITRTKTNLILIEETEISMFKRMIDKIKNIETVIDTEEINLKNDKTALSYYNMGVKLLNEQSMPEKAKSYFQKCTEQNDFDISNLNDVEKMIDICDIYLANHEDNVLAKTFEQKKYYKYAIKHYRAINNYQKVAILYLMLENTQEFENIIKKHNLIFEKLYSNNDTYNNKINNYLNSKINEIKNKTLVTKYYIEEINNNISNIL